MTHQEVLATIAVASRKTFSFKSQIRCSISLSSEENFRFR